MQLNYFQFIIFVLVLFQSFVYSDVTFTFPNQVVYDDSSQQFLSYNGNSPIERIANFSGLNMPLSSSAVVTVQIWFRHTYNSDVTIRLYSPDGDYIILSNQRGAEYDNVFDGTLFTDSALIKVSTYSFQNNKVATPLKPEQPFSNFRGKDPNGQWKIWLSDSYAQDDGYLDRVILTIQGKFLFFFFRNRQDFLKKQNKTKQKNKSIDDYLIGPVPHQTNVSKTGVGPLTLNWYTPVSFTATVLGLVNPLSSFAEITLQIWMPHNYSSACVVTLKGPTGTSIYITNGRGGHYANVFDGTLFTDSATNSVKTYNFNSNGVVSPLKPESPFSTFRGKNPNGQWRIDFSDKGLGDNGQVNKLIFTIQGKNY